jgi:hypothetical protein
LRLSNNSLYRGLVAVPQNHGTPGSDVVNILIVVYVIEIRTVAPIEKYGVATDTFECANRRINAAGNTELGTTDQVAGS